MNDVTMEMPRYQCIKKVHALEIATIGNRDGADGWNLTFAEPGYAQINVPDAMFARYFPMPGDFYVVYEPDGYASISPRKAFLDGYVRL